jgi:acetolactate synthase-1/2/3 large subunit
MKLNGAEIIIETLIEQGADTVFGYPGGSVLNLYDALYKAQGRIKHYITAHEQGAVHAADAYARVSGKTGVVFATSGPGATNLVTGIANAYLDSTPLVAITGNVATALIGRDSFQEVDICGITMPVTKHNFIVKDVALLADTLREAFKIASSDRPGPVLVDVPKDVQAAFCEFEPQNKAVATRRCVFIKSDFDKAVELIKSAEKPFIYAGGGIVLSGADKQLLEFANQIDAPVGTSMMGITAMDNDNPRYLGMTGMHGKYATNKLMAESDLVIAVGTRFSDRATGKKTDFSKGRKIVHIDIDPAEIGKNVPAYVSLVGDVKAVLKKLSEGLLQLDNKNWNQRVAQLKAAAEFSCDMQKDTLNPQTAIECVNRYAGGDTCIATDVGQHQMWTAQYYRFKKPRTFVTSGGLGAMGFGMGAAIGAAVGSGRRAVLFTSDGSFHMNLNECATAVSYNLPLLIVVMDNNALGMVRQWQKLFYGARYSFTTLNRKTDYAALAHAFGMEGEKAETTEEFEAAVKRGLSKNAPYLIHAVINPDEKVLPMIPPNGTFNDMILKG